MPDFQTNITGKSKPGGSHPAGLAAPFRCGGTTPEFPYRSARSAGENQAIAAERRCRKFRPGKIGSDGNSVKRSSSNWKEGRGGSRFVGKNSQEIFGNAQWILLNPGPGGWLSAPLRCAAYLFQSIGPRSLPKQNSAERNRQCWVNRSAIRQRLQRLPATGQPPGSGFADCRQPVIHPSALAATAGGRSATRQRLRRLPAEVISSLIFLNYDKRQIKYSRRD